MLFNTVEFHGIELRRMSNFRRTSLWADFDSKWPSPLHIACISILVHVLFAYIYYISKYQLHPYLALLIQSDFGWDLQVSCIFETEPLYIFWMDDSFLFCSPFLPLCFEIFQSSCNTLKTLLTISLRCVYFFILVCRGNQTNGAELEHHKINMNTKEKHIIRSILRGRPQLSSFTSMIIPIVRGGGGGWKMMTIIITFYLQENNVFSSFQT